MANTPSVSASIRRVENVSKTFLALSFICLFYTIACARCSKNYILFTFFHGIYYIHKRYVTRL